MAVLWLKISLGITIRMQFYMKQMLASHSLTRCHSNSLILYTFSITSGLQPCSKWTLADHSLNQLLFKFVGCTLNDYVTFLRLLKQHRTSDLNNIIIILIIILNTMIYTCTSCNKNHTVTACACIFIPIEFICVWEYHRNIYKLMLCS